MGAKAKHSFEFGSFRLDAAGRLLYREGELIPLPPKVFDTLMLLVANNGRLLTKDEMMKQLWPDTFVEEGTLAQYIFLLRKALGDSAEWIENHPRRGYRFTAPVKEVDDHHVKVANPVSRTRVRWIVAALVAAGVIAAAGFSFTSWKNQPLTRISSVAVLPFRTVPPSPDDYTADGITEALITKLAKVADIRVVSYSRVRGLKDKRAEAARIGRQLGVDAVIEGTLRVAAGRTRASVHVVESRTANVLWAEDSFEAGPGGLLSMERQLAEAVALRFRGQLTATERGLLANSVTSNAEAYDLVLRAKRMWSAQGFAKYELLKAMLGEALRRDPGYADAYGWLAFVQHQAYLRGLGGSDLLRTALSNATQALARDPDSLIAMRALSHIQHSAGRALEGLLMARRALERNPDDLDAIAAAAEAFFRTGLHDRAIPLYEQALSLEPNELYFRRQLIRIHAFSGEYVRGKEILARLPLSQAGTFGIALYAETGQLDKAVEAARSAHGDIGFYFGGSVLAALGDIAGARQMWSQAASRKEAMLERNENPHTRAALGYAYAKLGNREKALLQVRRMLTPDPLHPVFLFFASEIRALAGDRRGALQALQAAVENGFFNLPMIDAMARWRIGTLQSLRYDPEYLAIRADLARRVEELRAKY